MVGSAATRDAILNMFAFWWPEIGWQLAAAANRDAFETGTPASWDHTNRQYMNRLIQETSARGDEHDIRKKRRALAEAVEEMRAAQSHCSSCVNRCRDIEAAMMQATADQSDILLPQFSKRRMECQTAQINHERKLKCN